jgi:hypothetical protein
MVALQDAAGIIRQKVSPAIFKKNVWQKMEDCEGRTLARCTDVRVQTIWKIRKKSDGNSSIPEKGIMEIHEEEEGAT